jgi:hypothetical protein
LSEHPIFKDISSGANPQQAAWCYLRLMGGFTETHEGYEKRMESAHSVGDLRKLLGFKIYNDRTVLASIREENIANLLDTAQPMENVFLQTIVNWNKDYLMRLEK